MKNYLNSSIMLVFLVLVTIGSGCSLLGIRTVETPGYQVIASEDDKQIRKYHSYIEARTVVPGNYEEAGDEAFRRLFDYISGENVSGEEIEMTAPVTQEKKGEKIEMTAPVKQTPTDKGWSMGFVLPAEYDITNAPRPVNEDIRLIRVPPTTRAVLRYSGFTGEEKILRLANQLANWAESKGFKTIGKPVSARYDPPWTIPFLRRNEIWIEVEQK